MTSATFENVKAAKVNGTTLAYYEQGEGEPVLFVHGGTADLRIWANQLPVFSLTHRAISYSQRFALPNELIPPNTANPFAPHAADLSAFVLEIGAEPVNIVASSSGAFISLLSAIRHPERFRSLVLVEPPALSLFVSTPPRPTELLKLFATRPRTAIAIMKFALGTMVPVRRAFERDDGEKALQTFLVGVLGKDSLARVSEENLQIFRENLSSLRGGLLYDQIGFTPVADNDVRDLAIPVLLVCGEHSPAVFRRLADRLEELLPIVERITIPNTSHAMFVENAPAFNDAVLGFLRKQPQE